MSAARSALLVVVFVIVLVVTMQVLKRRYDALLLGTAFLPFLGAGVGMWALAACRLGDPDSVWARWTYRGSKAERAFDRWRLASDPVGAFEASPSLVARRLVDTLPDLVGGLARTDTPPERRPEPPRALDAAVGLLVVAVVLAAVAGSAVLVVAGVMLPNALLVRAGRVSAVRVVDVLVAAGGAAEVVRLFASGPGPAEVAVAGAALLTLAGAVALLHHRSVLSHLYGES